MKCKTICFCIRGSNSKSKENEMEDLEKMSHVKPPQNGKTKRGASTTTPAGDGADNNVHGGNTIASNDAAVAAAVMTAAHVSLMSVSEGQDGSGHGHGGESGADGGG
ncbi:hypothetical protein VNO77_32370 [Canavalia gladiata]|uniref:Uncharacterized protein n=1 Tax=Canavalia gladiata TaxID=3824 RepID=A0AAN9KTA7_CANGL